MNVEIIDSENILSKTQKNKIKKDFKNNKERLTQDILNSIHYSDESIRRYDLLEIRVDDLLENYYNLQFSYDNRKENLQKKLSTKIQFLKNKNRKDWIFYEKLRQTFGDSIPSPEIIRKNKEEYEKIQDNAKSVDNPVFKYINLCLEYS